MKKLILFGTFTMLFSSLQSQTIPLDSDTWDYTGNTVEFKTENGTQKMLISPSSGKVVAKNLEFSNGTIEFDSFDTKALSFFFRMKDRDENEYFYLRTARAGDSTAMDAIQYAPYIDGVLMWNIYPQYQSNANFSLEGKNHFKFVVSGSRMEIYINSETPTLEVDHLEGNFETGLLGFEGEAEISNVKIDPKNTGGLSTLPGIDPVANDPRYIRSWAVSEGIQIPDKIDFSYEYLPSPDTEWKIITTERRGLVNLTRLFGKIEEKRLNWLKLKIESEKEQTKQVDFGFLTEMWVFLNGQMLYLDKNLQGRLMAKKPDGRISIENTSFELPLKKGQNELLIGIANQAWGTGAMMRLDNLSEIKVSPDPSFDDRMTILPKASLKAFEGKYLTENGIELVITSDAYSLTMASDVFNGTAYPKSESLFFVREMNLDIQFLYNPVGAPSGMEFILDGKNVLKLEKAD
ncbi:hypothetical protein LZF95_10670 [Algoriphagus sp. AGSA1]|uniref:hypothetical protein n=1 Tax=Algoriphagus sp. AGSA1 TaxID=2907213 RepID=UPI001F41945E|nr:hypothetical protein [Algoriphagus sp. AGSA1]MCE7055139.1 hypothetical protein [Algoriphagus sp. AGSA1]